MSVSLLLFCSSSPMDEPWLRQLVVVLSPSTPEFDPRLVHMLLVVHTNTLGQVLFRVPHFTFVSIMITLLHIHIFFAYCRLCMGRDSSVVITTLYELDGPGIESRWGARFFRTRPDRPWGPPSLLYSWYRLFPGGKAAGVRR